MFCTLRFSGTSQQPNKSLQHPRSIQGTNNKLLGLLDLGLSSASEGADNELRELVVIKLFERYMRIILLYLHVIIISTLSVKEMKSISHKNKL